MSTLSLQIICLNPPLISGNSSIEFGLQDNDHNLTLGILQTDGSLLFSCDVMIKGTPGQGKPDFRGGFVHGTPEQRFLYLTLRTNSAATTGEIVKRLKIRLHTITWEQATQSQPVQVTVDGRGAASVPLLNGGWRVV
jgi:hypothetical protein